MAKHTIHIIRLKSEKGQELIAYNTKKEMPLIIAAGANGYEAYVQLQVEMGKAYPKGGTFSFHYYDALKPLTTP